MHNYFLKNIARSACLVALTFGVNGALVSPSHAEMGQVIKSFGQWDIHRSVDNMTDKAECTGTYKSDNRIQLNKDSLYIGTRGPQGFYYRIDDDKPSDMQLVSQILQRIGAVKFEGQT